MDKRGIQKDTIERCLSVLAQGKAEEIEKIFDVLEEKGISIAKICERYGWIFLNNLKTIEQTFSEGEEYLKQYMQLKGFYNRVISKEEIRNICKEKNIELNQFLGEILGEQYIEILKETLQKKEGIYVGQSIPVQKEFMQKNGNDLLELGKQISRNFCYQYRIKDKEEVESKALEIMINKCGNITWNCGNIEITKRMIYKKTFNYLKADFLVSKEILTDFTNTDHSMQFSILEKDRHQDLDLTDWKVDEDQKQLLVYISQYLEQGNNLNQAIDGIARELQIDREEILLKIDSIKNAMSTPEKGEEEK